MKFIIFILSIFLYTAGSSQQMFFAESNKGPVVGSYTLASNSITSAGVYATDGTLVRTLWSAQQTTAGNHSLANLWDGKDDDGNVLSSSGSYSVHIVSHNLSTKWNGGIGNSSLKSDGSGTNWHGYYNFHDMAIAGSYAYVAKGTEEAATSRKKFLLSNPQVPIDVLPIGQGSVQRTLHVATDGTLVYWAETNGQNTFIHATKTSDDTQYTFANGTPYDAVDPHSNTYASILDLVADGDGISGLAVGNYLFISRVNLNQVKVYNKTTGAFIKSNTITSPKRICVDGNNIWLVHNGQCTKYSVAGDGTITPVLTLSGLFAPIAVQINTAGNKLYVTDGGTSQQVKVFDNSSGSLLSTFGQVGGYVNSPTVANDKFMFDEGFANYIAFQSDGSYWISDYYNNRNQHFSSTNTFIDNVQYIGTVYTMSEDINDPTRLFFANREYQRDYTKTLDGGLNGSWKLIRNWGYNSQTTEDGSMLAVNTLSNGKTYCWQLNQSTGLIDCYELLNSTGLRSCGVSVDHEWIMKQDGNLYKQTSSENDVHRNIWLKKSLISFDNSNNPSWGSQMQIDAVLPLADTDPYFEGQGPTYSPGEISSTGTIISFDPSNDGSVKYHLGGVKNGKFIFKTAKVTHRAYQGDMPDDGSFDVGNSVNQYAGSKALVIGRIIVQGYHGEFWKAGQANIYNLFYDNGLFLGQFGVSDKAYQFGAAGMAGNAFAMYIHQNGDKVYLHHGDESYNAMIQEWEVDGVNSINEQIVSIPYPSSYTAPTLDYVDLLGGFGYEEPLTNKLGWTTSPASNTDIESGAGNWNVSVGKYSYKSPNSISFKYGGGEAVATRDLGTNNLTAWAIQTKIMFEGQPNLNGQIFYDIKDAAGKIITRVQSYTTDYQTFYVKVNNTILSSSTDANFRSLVSSLTQLNIVVNAGVITVTYGTNTPVTVTKYDSSANLATPKSVAITGTGNQYDHLMSFKDFRFYNNPTLQ